MARLISRRLSVTAEGRCDDCTWIRTGPSVRVKSDARSHILSNPEHKIIVRVVDATLYEGRRNG